MKIISGIFEVEATSLTQTYQALQKAFNGKLVSRFRENRTLNKLNLKN